MGRLSFALSLLLTSTSSISAQNCSGPVPVDYNTEKGFLVEKIGSVPAINTDAFTYNMGVMDNIDGDILFFLDQKEGKIYSYDTSTTENSTIFDKDTSTIPDGLDLNWTFGSASMEFRVKSMTQGPTSGTVIVVFCSSTLPTGWDEADAKLPAPGAFGRAICKTDDTPYEWMEDIYRYVPSLMIMSLKRVILFYSYRIGVIPDCSQGGAGLTTFTGYDVFYKYTFKNGKLKDSVPFFVAEVHVHPGHLGGGIATLPDGNIIWSPGDCVLFGFEGHHAPQLDDEWCGKIHLIETEKVGKYTTVAKGVRNSQQMRVFKKKNNKKATAKDEKKTNKIAVAFMDIGGVTA